ncbi:MAG: helix-turn-helix transcriptional regulator, partial [Bdellovibrionales bacterium]|nr:helix-turn-helix transcriptional regulator [Bdellovibrionales bacterium]
CCNAMGWFITGERYMIETSLGEIFKKYRQLAGFSQKEMSQKLGYSNPQMLSNFERGLCNLPIEKLDHYAQLCDLSEDHVLGFLVANYISFVQAKRKDAISSPKKLATK